MPLVRDSNMTLETYRALRPCDFKDYMKYIFIQSEPEEALDHNGSFDDYNFFKWLDALHINTIMRCADAYAGLLVSHNVQK